ncbi:hypothetical protein COCHEDRAFT_1219396 [Bipolaris maydis C5]|uniref:Uncharacterized protein n=2 Tax=Cochliobolus heterostrophus TaxID=5016 RepID=M2TU89_COCH5|nr:hypothetical protein COCHEDRAFT_1219396 [Bipolaris maydis C5]
MTFVARLRWTVRQLPSPTENPIKLPEADWKFRSLTTVAASRPQNIGARRDRMPFLRKSPANALNSYGFKATIQTTEIGGNKGVGTL